ncbi:unnamed protein product, partial [Adineta steineri]
MSSSSTIADILNTIRQYSVYLNYLAIIGGIFGHILNLLVFTQLKRFRNNRCTLYIIIESIIALIFLFISTTSVLLRIAYGYDLTDNNLIWCRMRFIFYQGLSLILFFTICCAACDQFCSTSYHFSIRHLCTLKLVQYLMSISSCLWFIHSFVFSLFLNIQPLFGCIITNPILTTYSTYFFYPFLYGPVQIAMAFLFSLLAFRNVRRIIRLQVPIIRRRLDQQMTAMILTRVLFFIILSLPYTIYRIYSINNPPPKSNQLQYTIGLFLQTNLNYLFSLNYQSSFYIFFAISSQYRRQVKYVLVKRCWQRWKNWYCIHQNQVIPLNIV